MNTVVRIFVLLAYVTLVFGLTAKEVLSPKFLTGLSEKLWGPLGGEDKASKDIRPFRIKFKDEVPENVVVIPLLIIHGWPGSVWEIYEGIPIITEYSEDRGFAVEVIVPSLPGFGFTDNPHFSTNVHRTRQR